MISTHRKRPLTKALGQIVEYCRRKITRQSCKIRSDVNEHPLEMYTPPPSRFSDAELEEMMRAQGVDPRAVEEYRFDVPTEFDLTRTVNGTGHTGPSEFCATSI